MYRQNSQPELNFTRVQGLNIKYILLYDILEIDAEILISLMLLYNLLKCKLSKVRFTKMNPGIRNSPEYRFRANEMIEPIDLSLKLNSLTISISKTVLLFHRF